MRGTVKFFDKQKGWGFIAGDNGTDYFVHYSNLNVPKYKSLDTDDIVDFEVGTDKNGREQAVNVTPILTLKMVENELKKEKLYLQTIKNDLGERAYVVVDENNVIQAGEQGMSLIEVAAYVGLDVEDLLNEKKEEGFKMSKDMSKNFKEIYVETVKGVTRLTDDYISERYDEACDSLKNLTEDNKKMLESCNIKIVDTTDLPSALTSIKERWNDYDSSQKTMISEMIAGVRGVSTLIAYLEA